MIMITVYIYIVIYMIIYTVCNLTTNHEPSRAASRAWFWSNSMHRAQDLPVAMNNLQVGIVREIQEAYPW
jgi:hypothetical protein